MVLIPPCHPESDSCKLKKDRNTVSNIEAHRGIDAVIQYMLCYLQKVPEILPEKLEERANNIIS